MGSKGRCWWILGWALHDESSTLQTMKLRCPGLSGSSTASSSQVVAPLLPSWFHSYGISMAPWEMAVVNFPGLGNRNNNPGITGFRCEPH